MHPVALAALVSVVTAGPAAKEPEKVSIVDCGAELTMQVGASGKSVMLFGRINTKTDHSSFGHTVLDAAFTGGVYTFIVNQDAAVDTTAIIRVSTGQQPMVAFYPVGRGAELGLPDLKPEFFRGCTTYSLDVLDKYVKKAK